MDASAGSGGDLSYYHLNVKAVPYNAAGDGTTDDTVAIQMAIDDAATAGGGSVFLPRGTYMVANLYMASNVQLIGTGMDVSTLKLLPGQADASYVVRASADAVTAATKWRVADLTIDGNKDAYGSADTKTLYGFYIGADTGPFVTDLVLERVRATNCKTYAMDVVRAERVSFLQCISDNNGYTTGTNNNCSGWEILSEHVVLVNCRSSGNGAHGFSYGQSSTIYRDALFLGCTAQSNGVNGFNIRDDSEMVRIVSCISESNSGAGVQFNTSKRGSLVGSTVRSNTTYGVRCDTATGVTINGNYIGANVTGGAGGTPEVALRSTTTGCIVQGNHIEPATTGGADYAVKEWSTADDYNIITGNVTSAGSSGAIVVLGANTINTSNALI